MSDKYALTVGINDYPGSGNDLSGCVNDSNDMAALLTGEGYQVQQLTDGAATKSAVLGALEDLVGKLGWSDRLVFHYSGHGSWVPDTNGDEVNGRDECICTYDFSADGFIIDDELHAIFENLKFGASALMLSDSCFSGTVTRFVGEGVAKFLSPTLLGVSDEHYAAARTLPVNALGKTANLISGCTDTEYSYDAWFNNRPNGAFTYTAVNTFYSDITLSHWYNDIRKQLPSDEHPQTPQLHASTYRKYTRAL